MNSQRSHFRLTPFHAIALSLVCGLAWTGLAQQQQQPTKRQPAPPVLLATSFERDVKPFLSRNCMQCHNADTAMSGVRVDQLDAALEDRHLKLWEGVRHRIGDGTMPPKGMPQPTAAERKEMVEWISRALETARLRPAPKNGLVRRLTVAQYRNSLRQLLLLDDDLTEILPPDAVSRDGFLNNKDTQNLSPVLVETYFEIAEEALNRAIVDPSVKPSIQNFRVDLGASINAAPFPDPLILGANSLLLDNQDFEVTQLTPAKPFPFEPFLMRTKYRFIEGYAGNDTVRGWREYDSIYHSVFACMRGSGGYPKGRAYSTVKPGLLLRPAIPNDEIFEADGTYGPKANFKISLRELPDHGRFRVTVTAAKYDDGLLLDPDTKAQPDGAAGAIVARDLLKGASQTVNVATAGIYQVDVYTADADAPPTPDASRLTEGLIGGWNFDGEQPEGKLAGNARVVDSPFKQAVSVDGEGDWVEIARRDELNAGSGDFTVAAWIHPRELRRAGIAGFGVAGGGNQPGWSLEMLGNRGVLRLNTTGTDAKSNGMMTSGAGVIRENAWQHVAAVVRRGPERLARLYVNGYAVAKGEIGPAVLDHAKGTIHLGGGLPGAPPFLGELDEARLYRRALSEAEIQALVEPGRRFALERPAERPQDLTLNLGGREFPGALVQPAFLAVRLPAGPLTVSAAYKGVRDLDRVVLTRLANNAGDVAQHFAAFEKRSPRLGVQVGLRRDCGSTFAPAGAPQTVKGTEPGKYIFEGAIRNFPSPDVEKDNVNYLAGVREIAVHSEYTDGRDMPRLLIRSVEFEGPFYETWPPVPHSNIFVASKAAGDSPAYARQIIHRFATRAYRRPVSVSEEAALMAVFTKARAAGSDFRQAVKDALLVALTSPQFLFLIENSATPQPEPITQHELASKLSYFLWNEPPDEAMLRQAGAGTLRKNIDAEVDRLVSDRRFSQFNAEFAAQWLSLDKFSVLEPDRKRYPKLTRDTRTQLRQEPIQFVEYLLRHNLPVSNLVQSDFLVANETVAAYYDLAGKTDSGFDFVAVPHGRPELGGVLTQAALMAGLSDGRESNPVKRGAWLARKIVAEPPDDPPPNVPVLKEGTGELTLRQRLEQHRNQPGCMQCHTKIDPWGVALEEFDAGGLLKEKPADARSVLPDKTEVSGANDLKRYLSQDRIDQVAFSVLKHLATYANGRSLTYNEVNQLKQDGLQLKASGYRMKDMVHFVVNSKMFLEK